MLGEGGSRNVDVSAKLLRLFIGCVKLGVAAYQFVCCFLPNGRDHVVEALHGQGHGIGVNAVGYMLCDDFRDTLSGGALGHGLCDPVDYLCSFLGLPGLGTVGDEVGARAGEPEHCHTLERLDGDIFEPVYYVVVLKLLRFIVCECFAYFFGGDVCDLLQDFCADFSAYREGVVAPEP